MPRPLTNCHRGRRRSLSLRNRNILLVAVIANGYSRRVRGPALKILLLTSMELNDRSFGGAMRSDDLRTALMACSQLDTVVIRGGGEFALDDRWSDERTRIATLTDFGLSPGGLKQRASMVAKLARLIRSEGYDLIAVRHIGLAYFVAPRLWGKLIIDEDDLFKTIDAGQQASARDRLKIGLRNLAVRAITRFPRHVWYANANHADLFAARSKSLLPNTLPVPVIADSGAAAPARRILMVGYFRYAPNREALAWFLDAVFPALQERYPDLTMRVVGRHDPGFLQDAPAEVEVRGYVDDISHEYRDAALVVAPIRSGGGTQMKIIDALMHGRPMVASAFSYAAFAREFDEGTHILVADDPDQWIERCAWVLDHPAEAEEMGRRGRQVATACYGTDVFNQRVAETVRGLVGDHG
jgi:glycosyltransferase involved in cell wall biosynthesis